MTRKRRRRKRGKREKSKRSGKSSAGERNVKEARQPGPDMRANSSCCCYCEEKSCRLFFPGVRRKVEKLVPIRRVSQLLPQILLYYWPCDRRTKFSLLVQYDLNSSNSALCSVNVSEKGSYKQSLCDTARTRTY